MPILSQKEREIIQIVGSNPELRFHGIGYHGGGQSRIIRTPPPPSAGNEWVVYEDITINIEEVRRLVRTPPTPTNQPRGSHVVRELVGATLTCGFTAITAALLPVGAAASPFTGGGSLLLTGAAWTGAVSGAAQCGLGLGRLGNEIFGTTNNDILDSSTAYQRITFAIDFAGVVSGLVSTGPALANFTRRLQGRLSSQALQESIRGANRAGRNRAIRELLDEMSEAERATLLREAQILERTAGSQSSTSRIISTLRQQETRQLMTDTRDMVLMGAQNSLNMLPSENVGVTSGSLNALLIDSESRARQDINWIYIHLVNATRH